MLPVASVLLVALRFRLGRLVDGPSFVTEELLDVFIFV